VLSPLFVHTGEKQVRFAKVRLCCLLVTNPETNPDHVYDLVLRLRSTVDEVGLYGKLTTSQWLVLCAAMDAIEDTQQAVEAFVANGDGKEKRPTGERYLRTYGVLQALAVQQDATKDLCDALSATDLWDPSPVEHVRDLRIASIGHPTLRRKARNRPQSSHFIVQISLGDRGFELMSFDSAGKMSSRRVSIPTLASTQDAHVRVTLKKVMKHIVKKWPP
jgi:hypothetical protein